MPDTFTKELSTGRKVKIRELSEDQIADLRDIPEIYFIGEEEKTIRNTHKANLAWLRCGLAGGDFGGFSGRDYRSMELIAVIQECQIVNPIIASDSD